MSLVDAADEKLQKALRDAAARRPGMTHAYRWALRRRMPLLILLAAVRGALDALAPFISDDLPQFARAGHALVTGHFGEVFGNSLIQVGPLQLIPFGLIEVLSNHAGIPLELGLTLPTTVAFTLFSLFVLRAACRLVEREPTPGFEMFFGLVIVLGGYSFEVATSSHPAEGFIPLFWLMSAIDARRERLGRAGLWLALAGGMKLWGVLGAPLLLLSPNVRRVIFGWTVQATLTAAIFLPFVLAGHITTFGFSWAVRAQSPLRLFLEQDAAFTWQMRIVQSAFIAAIGTIVAVMARRTKSAFWLVPLALVALRYLSDPLDYHYYWLSAGLIALVGASTRVGSEPSWRRVVMAAGFYLTLMPFFLIKGIELALWIAAASLAMLVFVAFQLHKERRADQAEAQRAFG